MTSPESAPYVHRDRNNEVVEQIELNKMAAGGNESDYDDSMAKYSLSTENQPHYEEGDPNATYDFAYRKDENFPKIDYETPRQKQSRKEAEAKRITEAIAWGADA